MPLADRPLPASVTSVWEATTMPDDELVGIAVTKAVTPSRTLITRGKGMMIEVLSDGDVHNTRQLLALLQEAEDLPPAEPNTVEAVAFSSDNPTNFDNLGDEVGIRRRRCYAASLEALAEIEGGGLVVRIGFGSPSDSVDTNPSFPYRSPHYGGGARYLFPRPTPSAPAFRLSAKLSNLGMRQFEPDLFLSDLLELDARSARCVREALDAYRRDMFLACASLLGAASEGAWYSAGERLKTMDPTIQNLVTTDSTAALQGAIVQYLRNNLPREFRWEPDFLVTQGDLMRAIRNYGVHPRATAQADLESFMTEPACGLLIVTTHRYLRRLTEAVDRVAPVTQPVP